KPHVTCGRYVWSSLWVDRYDEDGYYDGYETYVVRDTSQFGHPGFMTTQFVTTDLDESAAMFAVKILQWQIGEFE
ncbi:MAG TPA: hypothetical protein VJ553_03510, partial [Candidatus Paceibacterota bacterium]|nr:hypothetical protein [Candidatus Paceibacterota bacterium]